jgi:hypothetical protein
MWRGSQYVYDGVRYVLGFKVRVVLVRIRES